ncbi:MAG: hypothetical protein AAF718_12900 [Pseudomonadota bacterium]
MTADRIAVFLGWLIILILAWKHQAFISDDTFISLRYARNLAETGMLQWNPGEWAEGYTSALHVVVIGTIVRFGLDPVLAAHFVNICAAFGLVVATAAAARAVLPEHRQWALRGLTVLTLAATPPIAMWVVGGLEAVVVAFFLMAGLAALLHDLRRPRFGSLAISAVAFSLAVLTRLDASVFIAGVGIGMLLTGARPILPRCLAAACVVGIPAAVAFLHMGVRLNLYGAAFPLTFYVKTELPLAQKINYGWAYISRGFLETPVLGLAVVIILAVLVLRKTTDATRLILPALALPLGYLTWAGGDHMPAARMLVPLMAPAVILLLASVLTFARNTASVLMGVVFMATVALEVVQPPMLQDDTAFVGEIVGRHIASEWPEDITIALNTAGSTAYYGHPTHRFIDMLGLNDPVIATREDVPILTERQRFPGHSKGDGLYVLVRAPDRLIIGPAIGVDIADAWFLSGIELGQQPEFHRCYAKVETPISYDPALSIQAPERPNPITFTYYVRSCP